jgi:hypothetical protein
MIDNNEIRRMIEEDLDMKQFIWLCAINEEDINDASTIEFYKEQLKEAIDHYNFLDSMTLTDRISYVTKTSQSKLDMYRKYAEEEIETVVKCEDMLRQIEEWVPPTENHVAFKKYMVDKLKEVVGNGLSYYEGQIKGVESISPIEIFDRELMSAKINIMCMEDNLIREQERAKARREWVDQLINSIGLPADANK